MRDHAASSTSRRPCSPCPTASTCARSTCRSSCRSSPTTSSASRRRRRHERPRRGHLPQLRPVSLLEQVALDADGVHKLVDDVAACEHVTEATVIATCNRLEIYADVDRFHGSVEERLAAARRPGRRDDRGDAAAPLRPLRRRRRLPPLPGRRPGSTRWPSARARSSARPATRSALGQELGTVGPALNVLFQQALRVGKRARAETDIDSAAPYPGRRRPRPRPRRPAATWPASGSLVVGAGAMAGLATATVVPSRRRRASPSSTAPPAAPTASPRSTAPARRPWPTSRPSSPSPTWSSPAPGRPGCWSAAVMVESARTDGRPMTCDHRPRAAARRRPRGRRPAGRHPDQPRRARRRAARLRRRPRGRRGPRGS